MKKVIILDEIRNNKDKEVSHKLTRDEEIEFINYLEKCNREDNDEYDDFWEM